MDQPACLMAKLADTPTMRKAVFPVQTMTITSSRTPTGRRNLHNPLPEQSMRGALCNIYGSGCQGFEIGREYLYTKRGDCALQDSAPTAATVPGKALLHQRLLPSHHKKEESQTPNGCVLAALPHSCVLAAGARWLPSPPPPLIPRALAVRACGCWKTVGQARHARLSAGRSTHPI